MNDAEVRLQVKLDSSSTEKSVSSLNKQTESLQKAFTSAGKTLTVGLTVPIAGLIASGIKYNANMEQFQASLTSLLGSADKASSMLATLKQMANTTPFETTDLISATQTMLGFGMSAKDTMNALSMLGDVSMGNKDKLAGLSLVFAQVQSQGKLMGQDLLQMINNGFNPLTEISKMTGRSMADLKTDMENGAISADMVTQAFQHATSQGGLFYQAMDKQSQTTTGKISTLKDAFNQATGSLTASLLPTMTKVVDKLTQFSNWVSGLTDNQKEMILTILGVVAVIGPLLLIVGKTIQFINLLTAATWLWNGALLANPITWIVLAIVALIAIIVLLIMHWKQVTAVVGEVINSIVNFFSGLFNTIGTFINSIFSAIGNFFVGIWTSITDFIGQVVNVILGIINTIISILSIPFDFLKNVFILIIALIAMYIQFIYNLFEPIVMWIWNNVLSPIFTFVGNVFNSIVNFIGGIIESVKNIFLDIVNFVWNNVLQPIFNFFSNIFNGIWGIISGVINSIRDAFNYVGNFISNVFQDVRDTIANIFGAIGGFIKAPINGIIGGVNSVISALNKIKVPDWVPGIGGSSINFGQIPYLRTGTNNVQREGIAYLHQGEAVVPKKYNPALGGTSSNGNVYVTVQNDMKYDSLGQLVNNVKTFAGGSKNSYSYGV